MKQLQIQYLPTPEALAQASAVELIALLLRRTSFGTPIGIALSGGRIAEPFFRSVVVEAKRANVSFDSVHFFWTDERCVPPTSPESNYRLANSELFIPLSISPSNIHRIRAETDSDYAVAEAEAELCRLMPLSPTGQPVLDLVVLGMGEDGHTASLFPNEGPEWIADQKVYRAVLAAKPPPSRITLGYQPILAAREAWVLISGIGKLSAYRSLVAGDERLPIARVAARRQQIHVFQDVEKRSE